MNRLRELHAAVFGVVESWAPFLLPTLARLIFAGTLVGYFWASAKTKIGAGILSPSVGGYAQIFPRRAEELSYNVDNFSSIETLVVLLGTWAEFVLPALVVLGLLTRLAALGMIGFILVQSLVDIVGHGADVKAVGAWFDRASDSLILDQRSFWIFLLLLLVLRGGGPLSLDRLLAGRLARAG